MIIETRTAHLLDCLYEAAAFPEKWPAVLDAVARQVGALGGVIFTSNAGAAYHSVSPSLARHYDDYVSGGWMEQNERGAPMMAACRPGFITDTDFLTPEEMLTTPVYRDFLLPRNAAAGAGTALQGADHDLLVITLEIFAGHGEARAAMPFLNGLRPHLARALSLASQVQRARAHNITEGLGLIGSAAAIVGPTGRLRSANGAFEARLAGLAFEHRSQLRFRDLAANAALDRALKAVGPMSVGGSIVLRDRMEVPAHVLHLLPLRRDARDLFGSEGLLVLVAGSDNRVMPAPDLLRLLFDLTPAEARLARRLGEGAPLADAAADQGTTLGTARVHLRSIFQKTGVRRQMDLADLLRRYARPSLFEAS